MKLLTLTLALATLSGCGTIRTNMLFNEIKAAGCSIKVLRIQQQDGKSDTKLECLEFNKYMYDKENVDG